MEYPELREAIAKMIFHQTTMEQDWESRKDWVKEMYRKDTDQIINLIKEAGWVVQPKDQTVVKT
jgi:hypothetical protein